MQRLKIHCEKLPFSVENRLVNKYGFTVFSRQGQEWVIFIKDSKHKAKPVVVDTAAVLDEDTQNTLIKQCNKVVDYYVDPVKSKVQILARLKNIAWSMQEAKKREFILEWSKRWETNPTGDKDYQTIWDDEPEVITIQ